MYKPSKRVLSACLVAGMIFSVAGVKNVAEAGQTYDSTNVGIANKVGEYIEETTSADPISDLSDGAVSVKDIEVASEPVAEEVVAEDSSATDASVTDASDTNASAE